MKYRDYSSTDFANDSFFIRWVRKPDEESVWFWNSFIKENPACVGEIERARELISSLEFVKHELDEGELARIRNGLLLTLHAEKEQNKELVLHGSHWFSGKRPKLLKVAATLLMVPLFSFGLYFLISKSGVRIDGVAEAASSVVEERENPTG
ncbi:MAG TPA: hypothetical protein VIQ51_14935, partial [Chryseosolibacter sp.]